MSDFKSKTLTDFDRRQFIRAAVESATAGTAAKVEKARLALEKLIRNALIPADVRRKIKDVPEKYLHQPTWSSSQAHLTFAGEHLKVELRNELSVGVPDRDGALAVERDTPLGRAVEKWQALSAEHKELSEEADAAVRSIIWSVRTTKQLYDQWPNAKKVMPSLFSPTVPTTAVIPADAKQKADALLGFKAA